MPRTKRSAVNSGPLSRHFFVAWPAVGPWWWLYLLIVVFESVFFVLYLGNLGSHELNYVIIRIGVFIAVAISAVDLRKHRSFYQAREEKTRQRRAEPVGRVRRRAGWAAAAITIVFWMVAAIWLAAGAPSAAGTWGFLGAITGLSAWWMLKFRLPKWL